MRILQLCKKYPYPSKDGESLAILSLAQSLHRLGCQIDLLAMNTLRHYSKATDTPQALSFYSHIAVVPIDNRIKPVSAFLNLFSSASYHISRFIATDFETKLIELLQSNSYDVIQLETLYVAPYIPTIRKYSDAKVVMRSHNVEHEIWERITKNTRNPIKKAYLSHLTQKLRRFEIQQLANYDLIAAITPKDEDYFRGLAYQGQSVSIPIGIQSSAYEPSQTNQDYTKIGFIGSLDWMPNVEGLRWFLEKVWGKLKAKYPELTFHVAGRNPVSEIANWQQEGVTIHGEVEDAKAFINEHPIMLVPLLSGSGMRVKILEAMALARVVITTSVGVEGIHAQDRQEILMADTPEAFVTALDFCRKEPDTIGKMGKQARQFIEQEFDDTRIAHKLLKAYQSIVS